MSEKKPSNFCPLPWMSESHEIGGKARLCCHQHRTQNSEAILEKSSYLSSTDTEIHRSARASFLNGVVPEECQYCFSAKDSFSPALEYRKVFSSSVEEIKRLAPEDSVKPLKTQYLDLTLDSICNLKCRMCSPEYSKGIEAEWTKMGIPFDSPQEDEVQLLSKLERLLPNLKMLTLTGGEPFLSPTFSKILEFSKEYKHKITLRIYTNSSFFPESFIKDLTQFKELQLFLSIDGVGETQEYIRHPVKWEKQKVAIKKWLDISSPKVKVSTHLVLQALNATKLIDYLEFFLPYSSQTNVFPSVTRLTFPSHLRPNVLPPALLKKSILDIETWFEVNKHSLSKFKANENLLGLRQLRSHYESAIDDNTFKEDFMTFVLLTKKLDLIKEQSLHALYPELIEYSNSKY